MSTTIVVPELGESVLEATVAHWHKAEGERVAVGEVLVELETDKVNLDVAAQQDGVLARIERQQGEDVGVGDVLGALEPLDEATQPSPKRSETPSEAPAKAPSDGREQVESAPVAEKVTPVARRLAEARAVDLAQVSGSGPAGRVTREDVERYLSQQAPPKTPQPTTQPISQPADQLSLSPDRREERVRLSRRRQTIARRLVEAQQTAAMLTTFNDVDMGAVMALRARHKATFKERHGVSLGIASFFVKAAVGALKAFPRLNAEIQGDELVLKRYYDVGVAIGAEEGLVVPVLRDADRLSLAEIERAIRTYVQKTEEGSLSLEDLRGGTFTITNGGVFGSLLSTPILNPPQVGILGLHRIEQRPVALDGEVVIRPMMYLALSYDHRIVDGREAVQFLVRVKQFIEDPETLILEA